VKIYCHIIEAADPTVPKGSLKNNVTFCTPMHPVRLCCENSEYPDIPAFSRLASRAPQPPKWRTYFFVNPKALNSGFASNRKLTTVVLELYG
jgi:hypothetical protein